MKINLVCRFNNTGVGRIAENFFNHFSYVAAKTVHISHYHPDDNASLAHMLMKDHQDDITLFFNIQNPKFLKIMKSRKILWFFFESQNIPLNLSMLLNDYDFIWTPSQWGLEALLRGGIALDKIRVMPGGIDADIYSPQPIAHSGFVFLSVGKYEKRKGIDDLIKAFQQVFPPPLYPLVFLWLKANFPILPRRIDELKEKTALDPRIRVIDQDLPEIDILGLYQKSDAFIFPSRAEGFGLPALEALACGLPVAAINYSGQTEYLKEIEGLYLPIIYHMEDIEDPLYESFVKEVFAGEHFGQWASPDIKSLGNQMQQIYGNFTHWKTKALQASEIVKVKFDWGSIARHALNEFRNIERLLSSG